ncbi:Crp/Fnr family transcriptional regulator [Sinomicrobium kalidii]|uniref:Crp/Fnr family transcriptional regulator n=1 Tax=Sinomicrobium kalidii TaxID=2900738 RepID=UPI001E444F1B|nr:Crp/Fnr family transcriptional regulator [Sinomicrobium kalidii]UGU17226.1 Crp/Fnr family transcriptional regulator [Sinomicrobium kalidii]
MFSLLSKHIDRYVIISDAEKQHFFDALVLKTLKRNQFLLEEGEVCRHENFVTSGGLRFYETDETGNDNIIYFGFEDWWLTDKYSFLTGKPSRYNIQALENTEILSVDREKLEKLFLQIPSLERYFHIVLQETFAFWQNRILLMQKTAEEKYREFHHTYGHMEQRLSQQHIASYLGITRETLNRIRTSFYRKKT